MKAAMCKEHGVCLLLVPHTISRAGMTSFLKAQLQAHQIPIVTEIFYLDSNNHATCVQQPKVPAQPSADGSRTVQAAESDKGDEATTALVANLDTATGTGSGTAASELAAKSCNLD
jgi:hypothetical protein